MVLQANKQHLSAETRHTAPQNSQGARQFVSLADEYDHNGSVCWRSATQAGGDESGGESSDATCLGLCRCQCTSTTARSPVLHNTSLYTRCINRPKTCCLQPQCSDDKRKANQFPSLTHYLKMSNLCSVLQTVLQGATCDHSKT